MEKKLSKGMLMAALICGSVVPVLLGGANVYAAEAEDDALSSFTLDPMVVTAQRVETHDLDTPASVEVYNTEKVERSGAGNAYDLLQNTLGVVTQTQGINGASMGTMTSKIMIRGVEKGTLVLVDGVPMNMDGKYNLDDIPTESIERVEVVKGGGSVLYGSEATGGVVNIITKKKFKNKISVAAGNYGRERYSASVNAGPVNIIAGLDNRGKFAPMSGIGSTGSKTVYDYAKGERQSLLWNYKITDGLTFTQNFSKNRNKYLRRNYGSSDVTQINDYGNHNNNFLLAYDKDGWKVNASYGIQEKEYYQTNSKGVKSLSSWRKGHNTNLNMQKQFKVGKNNKLLIGGSFQKEDMDLIATSRRYNSTLKRNVYSLYASYDMKFGEKSNLYLNARETWATNTNGRQYDTKTGTTTSIDNETLKKFTPEIEYIYKVNDSSSIYAKAGKSFRLPNLTQYYGTGLIQPALDLKPEQGTHYEIGYKTNIGKSALRLAVFNFKIKDAIDADVTYIGGYPDHVDYWNEDIRNTGLEFSCSTEHDDNWSSNFGFMINNPQARNVHNYGDNNWHDYYGKYQITGGFNYKNAKFTGSFNGNFVGNRTSSQASLKSPARHLKPQFFTDIHLTYSPESNHKFFVHFNNILNRRDITTNSTSNFYNLGHNFMAGYEMTF